MNDVSKNEGPSGLSIAALITGILWLGIVPIILGAVDLSRIKNGVSGAKGKGFDIAGIVLGAIAILFWIIFIIIWVVVFSALAAYS
ncbi:MAG: hypothetical protein AVO38_00730 [delta proteobacterium ML8_D]|jgi:hypothetical protein|nr:MAG: hypothetical protein AVO38_00730 [delta proteobacterium ML8_D]